MKFFSQYFWGVLLICVGVAYLLRYNFNINIPIFRTAVGLIIVFLGLSILFGGFGYRMDNGLLFSSGELKADARQDEYHIIFSSGQIDLSGIVPDRPGQKVKIDCIFSSGVVVVGKDQPVVVHLDSAFGSASVPNGTTVNFGEANYRSGEIPAGTNYLHIEADAVFGSLKIVTR